MRLLLLVSSWLALINAHEAAASIPPSAFQSFITPSVRSTTSAKPWRASLITRPVAQPGPVDAREFQDMGEVLPPPPLPTPTPTQELPLIQLALAGSITTFFADMSMHPIDCIKTLQQSDAGISLTFFSAMHSLWDEYGILGFFHGFLTYAASDAMGGALKFSVWEYWKRATSTKRPAFLYTLAGASLAFLASSVLIVPGEFCKQQLQMGHFSSLGETIQSVYGAEGIKGFFAGYDGVLFRDVPYTMFELGLYDAFKGLLLENRQRKEQQELQSQGQVQVQQQEESMSTMDEMLAAAVTGAITATATTPLDTIKTKLMVDDYSSFLDCLVTTIDHHGVSAVFAGVMARIAWIVPFTVIYLPTYDYFKRQLEKRHEGVMQRRSVMGEEVGR